MEPYNKHGHVVLCSGCGKPISDGYIRDGKGNKFHTMICVERYCEKIKQITLNERRDT